MQIYFKISEFISYILIDLDLLLLKKNLYFRERKIWN